MLNADTKRIINNARDILVGKVPNPQSQVDLITIAMIYKFMDDMDLAGLELAGKRTFFVGDLEKYAFSKLLDPKLGNQGRMNLYTEALEQLPLAASVPELFRTIFRGAFLPFRDPQTLTMFLKEINNFSYDNSENIGNAFEYLLSIMGAQGDAGQFRTPRHIIDFMVDVIKPQKDETILDPACGTAGFLISAYLYIKNHNKDLSTKEMQTLNDNITGYDISPDMRKLALVNLYLHKFADPNIYEYDTLTSEERWNDKFDVILANPPFMTPKGGIVPHNRFGVQANKSEVLFVDYIAEHLNLHGRAGIIVPEGIIFQSATAYKKLRKMLIDENYLYAVVSLPAGIFNPYAGVKTSILLLDRQFAKTKNEILFVKVENDGYDLGAQRREIKKNDLPAALHLIEQFKAGKEIDSPLATIVEKEKVRENGEYNLTAGRYANDVRFDDCKYDFVKIRDVAEYIRGITFAKKDQIYDGDTSSALPVATTKAAQDDGVHHEDLYFIPKKLLKNEKQILRTDDILISIANSLNLLGRITPVEKCDEGISFGAFMGLIRADSTKIHPKFLLQLLKSDLARNYFYSHANTTTNISNLTSNDILEYTIPLPPMDVQEQIVAEIGNKQQAINHAIEIRKNLERERDSILEIYLLA
jgi:type I restriction enzyme M protein